jgi:6-phosphogluconate dehydrogenase (decarboxylating)
MLLVVMEKAIGKITHFFPKINVAVVELAEKLEVGDEILVKGKVTNFRQAVESMQVEHEQIQVAEAGTSIGMKVQEPVEKGDIVYKEA